MREEYSCGFATALFPEDPEEEDESRITGETNVLLEPWPFFSAVCRASVKLEFSVIEMEEEELRSWGVTGDPDIAVVVLSLKGVEILGSAGNSVEET